jgi:hypothetical protein
MTIVLIIITTVIIVVTIANWINIPLHPSFKSFYTDSGEVNMSYECDICGKTFANASNLLRHKKVVHAYGTRNLGQQTLTVNGVTVKQHPFTCIVAGCTQSGKTVWVKSLLENAQTTISPTPQRIIGCYGQWQPSYFDMMRKMPGIEFNEGIPEDIDNADYLDVSQRNLIVLDDLIA